MSERKGDAIYFQFGHWRVDILSQAAVGATQGEEDKSASGCQESGGTLGWRYEGMQVFKKWQNIKVDYGWSTAIPTPPVSDSGDKK